jgi:TRAP-type C4-dicarboxylate transport system permease small subunit
MLSNIDRSLRKAARLLHRVGTGLCLPVMAGLVTLDVVLRYFFNSPLSWAQEGNGLLLLCVFMLSISTCWYENKHIRMELLYERFGKSLRSLSDTIASMIGMLFFSLLSYRAFKDIPYMIKTNEVMEELPAIPLWPFMALIGVVSLFFCLNMLLGLALSLKSLTHKKATGDGLDEQK